MKKQKKKKPCPRKEKDPTHTCDCTCLLSEESLKKLKVVEVAQVGEGEEILAPKLPPKLEITDFDGVNVHDPDNFTRYTEFPTLEKAQVFLEVVKDVGFVKANELLEKFRGILC